MSPPTWRALLQAPLAVFGTVSIAAGLCLSEGVDVFLGAFAMVACLGATVLMSWFLASTALPVPYAWCWVVGAISAMGGIALGRTYFDRLLLDQISKLEAQLARTPKAPNLLDVEGAAFFRQAMVTPGPGKGIEARFGMRDGSVLTYVSDASYWPKEAAHPCSKEVKPGWYRRWRCD